MLLRNLYKFPVDMQLDYESDPPLDDTKAIEKESSLNIAVSQLANDFDRDSNLCLERFSRTRKASVVSTGSLKLDLALGVGGLPKVIMCSCHFICSHNILYYYFIYIWSTHLILYLLLILHIRTDVHTFTSTLLFLSTLASPNLTK